MFNKISVRVVNGTKTYISSKKVVGEFLQGNPINEGDVGAYLVGVFACQPLTTDEKRYNLEESGQWKHCLYKNQWKAVLQGRDEFTDEQRGLILAGSDLLKRYPHGWGGRAVSQNHVNKLLKSWGDGNK
jgi:hypothetical protein